ncbi:MAG: DUF402 domain-containing protein [Bacilli bacterium]
MKKLKAGDRIEIQSYKHNGSIHRIWRYGVIIAVNEEYITIVNNRTRVIESNGRIWFTREPAVCYFFTKGWYNIISMLKNNGVHYYCNIASPYLYDGEALKYVDYDLDLKVFPNKYYKVLDENEYQFHTKMWNYPDKLDYILRKELQELIEMIKTSTLFSDAKVKEDYQLYLNRYSSKL